MENLIYHFSEISSMSIIESLFISIYSVFNIFVSFDVNIRLTSLA